MKKITLFLISFFLLAVIIYSQINISIDDFNIVKCAKYGNVTYTRKVPDKQIIVYNSTLKNNSYVTLYKIELYNVTECIDDRDILQYNNADIDIKDLQVGITKEKTTLYVDDVYDGNGDGICQPGESCCIITDKIRCTGYNAARIRARLKAQGIQ